MSEYHKLPIAQKRAIALDRAREPAVTCPDCDTQVMPADLIAHVEQRCTGVRDPGPGAKWLTFKEVMALDIASATLTRWVQAGEVRFEGEVQCRKYLLRDLALKVAQRKSRRRR